MTRTGRALLGAMVGAALTLAIHPASRPYLFATFISPTNVSNSSPKGMPEDVVGLSDWMLALGDRYISRQHLTTIELNNALAAAQAGANLDKKNAYWYQMLAYLYHQLGKEAEAREAWRRASVCESWNDYQSSGLLHLKDQLSKDFGAQQSWQFGYVYYQRNENAVVLIRSYSKTVLADAPFTTDAGLELRAANVFNGALLREGSRSIHIGNYGAEMSELACHPPELSAKVKPYKLFLARMNLHNMLRRIGKEDMAERVNYFYKEADAWDAYENEDEASQHALECSWLGLAFVGIPSMLLVVGAVGLVLWLLGVWLRKVERVQTVPALAAGFLLAVGAFAITFLPLVSLATFLCCAFLTLGPRRERTVKVNDLGPMFSFTVGTLGSVFMLLLGAFVVGTSAPAASLLPFLGVPHEYFGGSGVLLGLAIILLAILLLLAPLFATALRVGTGFVLGLALRKFGAFLGYSSLAIIVLGTPLCIYLDRDNSETLRRLVLNEPVYYLNLQR